MKEVDYFFVKQEKLIINFILIFFILIFISDFISKCYNIYSFNGLFLFRNIFKIIFEIIIVLFAIFKKGKGDSYFYLFSILLCCFLLGNSSYFSSSSELFSQENLTRYYLVNRYLFVIFFVIFFKKLENKFYFVDKFIHILKFVLYFNSLLILIGLVFEIEVFKSFPLSNRFGYSGLFPESHQAAFMYFFMVLYEYFNGADLKRNIRLIIWVIILLLLGKKISLLFLFLLFFYHLIQKRKLVLKLIPFVFMTGIIVFKDYLLKFYVFIFPFWNNIFEKESTLYLLTSSRNQLFVETIKFINDNWLIKDYLFGGIDYLTYRVEFEFFDLFLFFGAIGAVAFLSFIFYEFFQGANKESLFFVISVLIISFVSGGLFLNVNLMISFFIFKEYFLSRIGNNFIRP